MYFPVFRFRAFPWDTAGGQLGRPGIRRPGRHARPFVTKNLNLGAVQRFANPVDFILLQTAARGVQAATGSNTRVALQQCPKEKLENETQENTCYKPWLPEGVHLNTRLTNERVTKKYEFAGRGVLEKRTEAESIL